VPTVPPPPPAPARAEPPAGLLRDPDFRRFWSGRTASQIGEQAAATVLPLLAVVALHAGPGRLGLLRAAEQAPILLLSLLSLLSLLVGVWADRRRATRFMVLADLVRAAVLAAVPLACRTWRAPRRPGSAGRLRHTGRSADCRDGYGEEAGAGRAVATRRRRAPAPGPAPGRA
jgi:hypothetical protein